MKKLLLLATVCTTGVIFASEIPNVEVLSPFEPNDATIKSEIVILDDNVNETRFEKSLTKKKIYLGLGVGKNNKNGKVNIDGASATFITGIEVSDFLNFEFRYSNLIADADYNGNTKNVTLSNVALFLKQKIPLSERVNPYGLIGWGRTTIEDQGDNGLQWGLGLDYSYNSNVSFFGDYVSVYSGEMIEDQDIDMNVVTFGTLYTF